MEILPSPIFSDEPKIGVYAARSAGLVGHGVDLDPDRARLKAAAEALERGCLKLPAAANVVEARFGELDGQVDPAVFWNATVGDREERNTHLRETPRLWVRASRAGSEERLLIPAEVAYIDAARRTDAPVRPESISTGAALGAAGTDEALFRGLCEVIERDAFLAAWFGAAPVFALQGPFDELEGLLGQLRRYRLEPRLFDLGSELGPPSVLAVTIDRSGLGPAVTAGIAARGTYYDAARSALLESVASRRGIRLAMAKGTWPAPGAAAEIDSIESRAAFWTPLATLDLLPRWVFDAPPRPFASVAGEPCGLARAVEELAKRRLDIYSCDLTSPALAANGFEVLRVVVPRLLPLHMAERAMALRSWRGVLEPDPSLPPHPFV